MTTRPVGGTMAVGLAALAVALDQGSGAQVSNRGELPTDLVLVGFKGWERCDVRHGASSMLTAIYTDSIPPSPPRPIAPPTQSHRYVVHPPGGQALTDSASGMYSPLPQIRTRGGAVWSARRAHNPKVAGSNPAPATGLGPGPGKGGPAGAKTARPAPSGSMNLPLPGQARARKARRPECSPAQRSGGSTR